MTIWIELNLCDDKGNNRLSSDVSGRNDGDCVGKQSSSSLCPDEKKRVIRMELIVLTEQSKELNGFAA